MSIVQTPLESSTPHMNGISLPVQDAFKPNTKDSDVILLSDEDEEIVQKKARVNSAECSSKQEATALVRQIEVELCNEEAILNLLQQIRSNQRGSHHRPHRPNYHPNHNNNNINPIPSKPIIETIDISSDHDIAPSKHDKTQPPAANIKVTKQMALAVIEQQFATKRANLRKQLEKSLEKISIPSSNAGSSEIAFVPSVFSGDFLSLIGLEEVCRGIRDFDPFMTKPEPRRVFNPFTCARCDTDFTPVWKRDKPGSTGVACEACLAGSYRTAAQKEYDTAIKAALKIHSTAEKDIDKEYNDLINSEEKLQAFMKEHEKKLNEQMASNPNQNSRWSSNTINSGLVNGTNNRTNGTLTVSHNNVANGNVASVVSSTANTVNSLQQQQLTAAQAQLLVQIQQQQKTAAATTTANSQTNAILSAMAASGASNMSQQQQRLNSLIAQIQGQQHTPQEALQMAQIQQALLNSLTPAAQPNNGANASSQQQQQVLNSVLLQYQLLRNQQPSMQQLAMAQQQQQQQQMLLLQAAQQQQQYLQILQNLQQQQSKK